MGLYWPLVAQVEWKLAIRCMQPWQRTLLQHVIMRLEPQVDSLVINADPDICGQYSPAYFSHFLTLLWLTVLRVFVGH